MTLVCQTRWDEGVVCIFADLDYFKVVYTAADKPLHLHEIRYPDGTPAVPESRPLDDTFLHPPTCWQDELEQDFPGYEVLLFFLIRPEDLAAHHFDRVRCVLYSY